MTDDIAKANSPERDFVNKRAKNKIVLMAKCHVLWRILLSPWPLALSTYASGTKIKATI